MSFANPSKAKPPAHHTKMLAECLAKGWIKRVGDSYEITDAGHAYTMQLSSELHDAEQPYARKPSTFAVRHPLNTYKRWE